MTREHKGGGRPDPAGRTAQRLPAHGGLTADVRPHRLAHAHAHTHTHALPARSEPQTRPPPRGKTGLQRPAEEWPGGQRPWENPGDSTQLLTAPASLHKGLCLQHFTATTSNTLTAKRET